MTPTNRGLHGNRRPLIVLGCAALMVWGIPRAVADGRITDAFKRTIRARVESGRIVGIVVGVIDAEGREYFAAGRVAEDGSREPDENTVFEIGSITKVFTATVLADMIERGEVALDDPIDKFLPKDSSAPTRDGKSIRLIDLATHRSGLPRMPGNFRPTDFFNPYADYSAEQLFDFLSNYKLRRDIGAEYEYSNLGFGLLGTLLSRRAGTPLEELIKSRITSKLGMSDTAMTMTPSMKGRLAKGHRGKAVVSNWDFQALAGAGALRSTTHDMLRFLAANMGLAETPLEAAIKRAQKRRRSAGSDKMAIGLGWHIHLGGKQRVIWHNGGTGGYRSFTGFLPDEKRGIVILTNSSQDNPDDIGMHWLDPTLPLREH